MSDIVDLAAERNKREQPDPEFVRKDEYGRPMYHFGLRYGMDDAHWGVGVWAYSAEDAERRCAAMRESLTVEGQTYCCIPG